MGDAVLRAGRAAVVAGLAVALATMAAPVQAAVPRAIAHGPGASPAVRPHASLPHWTVSYRSYSGVTASPLAAVAAPSATDGWAAGSTTSGGVSQPVLVHWNGTRWATMTLAGQSGFVPSGIYASGADNVWLAGLAAGVARVLRWNGKVWHPVTVPSGVDPSAMAVESATDVWASGGSACGDGSSPRCSTLVWHFNGTSWASATINGLLQDVTGAGGQVWFVTATHIQNYNSAFPSGLPTVFKSAGKTLVRVLSPTSRSGFRIRAAASPAGLLWLLAPPTAGGQPSFLDHWTGTAWTVAAIPATAGGRLVVRAPLSYDGHSGVWTGPYARWTGARWVNLDRTADLPGPDGFLLNAIATIPGTGKLWSAGWAGRSATNPTQDSLIAVFGGNP